MDFPKPIPVTEIAKQIGAKLYGDKSLQATGMNEIHHVRNGDITFADIKKYFQKAIDSAASIIILSTKAKCPKGKAILVCDAPFAAYNSLVLATRPIRPLSVSISKTATVDASTIIEPNVVIGHEVKIGKNCHIQANVTIQEHSIIGNNVLIQSGTVIGSDAFCFRKAPKEYQKWRSGGRVIIEDNVDIGSCCTINKGVSADTIIGEGSKLDCQVQIGHDVVVGKNCLIAGQVGIGGNSKIGDWTVLYGQVGIAQNVVIGERAIISAKAGVSKSLDGGKLYFGIPASDARSMYRELAALRHLPDFFAEYYK